MKYEDMRDTIRSGDLLSFNHGDWKSWSGIKTMIVHMATRSTYSHVAIAWRVGGRVMVLEAVKPKLRIFPLSLSGNFYITPTNAPWKYDTEEYALSKIGVDYSEINAVIADFKKLPDGDVSECAAYVREILLRDGIYLGDISTPEAVTLAAQRRGFPTQYVENE